MSFKKRYNLALEESMLITDEPMTVTDAIEASEAEQNYSDAVVELEQDQAALEEAEAVVDELQEQVDNNEILLQDDPSSVTEDIVTMSQEAYYNAIGRLGYNTKDISRLSIESSRTPISNLRLSTEGIKEFIDNIIKKIKAIFKKVVDWFKSIWNSIFAVEKNIIRTGNELIKTYEDLSKNKITKVSLKDAYQEYVPLPYKLECYDFQEIDEKIGGVGTLKQYQKFLDEVASNLVYKNHDDITEDAAEKIYKSFMGINKIISTKVMKGANKTAKDADHQIAYSLSPYKVRTAVLKEQEKYITLQTVNIDVEDFQTSTSGNKDEVDTKDVITDLKYMITRALPRDKLKKEIEDTMTDINVSLERIDKDSDKYLNNNEVLTEEQISASKIVSNSIKSIAAIYRTSGADVVPNILKDHITNLKAWLKVYNTGAKKATK